MRTKRRIKRRICRGERGKEEGENKNKKYEGEEVPLIRMMMPKILEEEKEREKGKTKEMIRGRMEVWRVVKTDRRW